MVNIIKDDSMVYGTDNRHKFWWNQKKLKGLGGQVLGQRNNNHTPEAKRSSSV